MSLVSEKNTYIIMCSRCGNEYSSDARYCMKCGNLNPDHPSNRELNNLIGDHKEGYTVGEGQVQIEVNKNEVRGKGVEVSLGSNTGNFNLCFVVNIIIYLALIMLSGLFYAVSSGFDWRVIVTTDISIVWIIISLIYILLYSIQLVFMKMNKPWWSAFIPFYNNMMIADSLYGKPIIGFLTIIPGIGLIIQLVLYYKLGSSFKKSGLFTILLPFVMFPIIGFGGSAFNGLYYVSGRNSLEKEFKKKNGFLTVCVLFLFLGFAMYVYANYNKIKETGEKRSTLYLVPSAKLIESQLSKKIEDGEYSCDIGGNVLYFYFNDISDQFTIPYAIFVDTMSATIKVDMSGEEAKYYIALTDGKNGFPETLSTEITADTVGQFNSLNSDYKFKCRVKR